MEKKARAYLNYFVLSRNVYIASDNIISSLGFTTSDNQNSLLEGNTGIKLHEDITLSPVPFWASLVNSKILTDTFSLYANPGNFTRFEQLVICSINDALRNTDINISSNKTLVIISTTKGNVDLLDRKRNKPFNQDRTYLWNTAGLIKDFFKLSIIPMVISNACISGVLAIIAGSRLIRSGTFDNVIVVGADIVSEFVISGFNSFLSLCQGPCKPFDKDRQGLSLGEAAGTVVLTCDETKIKNDKKIFIGQGFSSNDANHISGPSRTGEGLYIAIKRVLEKTNRSIDYISAHGTATPYNDEMESIALTRAELNNTPVNSLKGFWGHTLGAAGVIESVSGINSLRNNILIKTLGYATPGVTNPINIIDKNKNTEINTCLKIASGFGGCNASILFYK